MSTITTRVARLLLLALLVLGARSALAPECSDDVCSCIGAGSNGRGVFSAICLFGGETVS